LLSVTYWGFVGAAHQGQLVVNVSAVSAIRSVFQQLLAAQFNRPGHSIVEHYTYFVASDGDASAIRSYTGSGSS
jgi:hypothetical protein